MITVFPAASSNAQEKRLVTEYNICNIVNRLVDKKSFVISANAKSNPTVIEFNISGYFFRCNNVKVDILDQITDQMKKEYVDAGGPDDNTYPIYAYIETTTSTSETSEKDDSILWTYLPVSNAESATEANRAGLKFTLVLPQSVENYLYLVDFHDGSYYIPAESWIRFNQNSIFIDDGDLDSTQS